MSPNVNRGLGMIVILEEIYPLQQRDHSGQDVDRERLCMESGQG
jgi:hypothetical protein